MDLLNGTTMRGSDYTGDGIRELLPSYLISIHPGGRAVYLLTLLLVISMLGCLPLVSIRVSVSGGGIIRPRLEKTNILATTSGIIGHVYVKEGERVRKSAPLIQIRSPETRQNLESLKSELREAELHLQDLGGLTVSPVREPRSARYSGEYQEYLDRLDYLGLLHRKACRELDRYEGLYRAGLISVKEYDDLVFTAEKAGKEVENFKSQSLSKWQSDHHRQADLVRDLQAGIRDVREQLRLTTVYAPATGSMVEFNGIFEGSAVHAGSIIGVLSPESGLIGEFYVSPGDMAYIRVGQEVQLHLDAFNSREWGIIPGRIYEISSDVLIVDRHPVYRVKCSLGKTEMRLRNGYSAGIKKGMTFQARCMVARRTLFQLLADKAENWLNPVKYRREFPVSP